MTWSNKRKIAAVSAIAIAMIVVVPSLFLFSFINPSLSVTEGISTHTVIGELFSSNITKSHSFSNLNATTILTENGDKTFRINSVMSGSILNLNDTKFFYISSSLYVSGDLPGNLHPTGLRIAVNPLKGNPHGFSDYIKNYTTQNNSTYLPTLLHPLSFVNASSSQGRSVTDFTFSNVTGLRTNQVFNFDVTDMIFCGGGVIPTQIELQYNTTYAISITISLIGLNKLVSTAFYLYFISVPKI